MNLERYERPCDDPRGIGIAAIADHTITAQRPTWAAPPLLALSAPPSIAPPARAPPTSPAAACCRSGRPPPARLARRLATRLWACDGRPLSLPERPVRRESGPQRRGGLCCCSLRRAMRRTRARTRRRRPIAARMARCSPQRAVMGASALHSAARAPPARRVHSKSASRSYPEGTCVPGPTRGQGCGWMPMTARKSVPSSRW
mmetsp:Transcript_3888/g.11507  ORF Transcript_3888/g.11507 Transcript_3888/m.11507 type:complete len:202 (-) Transcript_3888:1348-1953(-)